MEVSWEDRKPEQSLLVERCLVLLRNLLHTPATTEDFRKTNQELSSQDSLIWLVVYVKLLLKWVELSSPGGLVCLVFYVKLLLYCIIFRRNCHHRYPCLVSLVLLKNIILYIIKHWAHKTTLFGRYSCMVTK